MPPHLAGDCEPVPSLVWLLLGDNTLDVVSLSVGSIGHDLEPETDTVKFRRMLSIKAKQKNTDYLFPCLRQLFVRC